MEETPQVNPTSPDFNNTVDALDTWYNNGFMIGLRQANTKTANASTGNSGQVGQGMGRMTEESFKPSGSHGSEGRPCPYTTGWRQTGSASCTWGSSPVDSSSTGNSPYKYWNEDALSQWLGLENLGWALLDGYGPRCLWTTVPELTW